jgi:threonine synthase
MQYYSTNGNVARTNFQSAVIEGLAKDKGLFMPEQIPALPADFFKRLPSLSLPEIAFEVARPFIGDEIPAEVLKGICEEAFNFPVPLVKLRNDLYILELFHGPTLAFKDVGARFMSRVMSYFLKNEAKKVYVLVATSGDTGSAVAQGFYRVPGIEVIILYPSGKVSRVQEQQFCTLGDNITALEVEGSFDDCQRLVKTAFSDPELRAQLYLTSANSINFARLLPQSFYYYFAYAQLLKQNQHKAVFSIPSGNYGNLTAGLFAATMGLPVHRFLAASNANDTVPLYLQSGEYGAKPSVATLSSAMDVGDPSNFARMQTIFGNSVEQMRSQIIGYSFNDAQTKTGIAEVYAQYDYLIDPHGAVGYLAYQDYCQQDKEGAGIVLATAHPAKFPEAVQEVTGINPSQPQQLKACLDKAKKSFAITADFSALKSYLQSKV